MGCIFSGMEVERDMKEKRLNNQGFTLTELLVAMAIASIVLSAIFVTFKSQQDSYVVQSQVAMTQQNVRGAMQLISRDVQMAGYYTNFETSTISMDWDGMGGNESMRPLIYARDNISGVTGIKNNTDLVVIVKASMETKRVFGDSDSASGTTALLPTAAGELAQNNYAILVKEDLSRADFFKIDAMTGTTLTLSPPIDETYSTGDLIYRADIIIYYVSDADDPDHPKLMRRNLGNNEGVQVVAEDIDNLQFRYVLEDGSVVDAAFNEGDVRAVEIYLLGKTRNKIRGYTDPNTYNIGNRSVTPNDHYRRRLLMALIKTRNRGL
jgi:prepilin-type N-terminal cleavage/methylation domain-containing protein